MYGLWVWLISVCVVGEGGIKFDKLGEEMSKSQGIQEPWLGEPQASRPSCMVSMDLSCGIFLCVA